MIRPPWRFRNSAGGKGGAGGAQRQGRRDRGTQLRAENVLSVESACLEFSVLRGQGWGRQNCS